MKIAVLDKATLGYDTRFDSISALGEVDFYNTTEENEISERCKETDVIIINKVKISEKTMSELPRLKLICVFATGYDNIDIAAARKRGIAVCNVPGYSTDSVAMFTVATVLSLATHLSEYSEYVKSGEYTSSGCANRIVPVYHEIKGKKWGIVGYGSIGRAVGRVATALGAEILAFKSTPTNEVKCVDIDTLCCESDIITLHLPLNDKTKHLIDRRRIELMKRDVILVNAARGAVVNEVDVSKAIKESRIGAFGCDVYTTEPFSQEHPYYEIMNMKNVLLTPHAAWAAYEARERCVNTVSENIKAYFDGKIKNRVDITGQN